MRKRSVLDRIIIRRLYNNYISSHQHANQGCQVQKNWKGHILKMKKRPNRGQILFKNSRYYVCLFVVCHVKWFRSICIHWWKRDHYFLSQILSVTLYDSMLHLYWHTMIFRQGVRNLYNCLFLTSLKINLTSSKTSPISKGVKNVTILNCFHTDNI